MSNSDSEKKLRVYELILSRYKNQINEKEDKSLSEVRKLVSPYSDSLKSIKEKILKDLQPYVYEKHFFSAVQKCVDYIKSIENIYFPVHFWMSFEELDQFQAGPIMDQAILLCSLLRSLGSSDAKIYKTEDKIYVGFKTNDESYLIDPRTGSMLRGIDAESAFKEDNLRYAFSDSYFESFEE